MQRCCGRWQPSSASVVACNAGKDVQAARGHEKSRSATTGSEIEAGKSGKPSIFMHGRADVKSAIHHQKFPRWPCPQRASGATRVSPATPMLWSALPRQASRKTKVGPNVQRQGQCGPMGPLMVPPHLAIGPPRVTRTACRILRNPGLSGVVASSTPW